MTHLTTLRNITALLAALTAVLLGLLPSCAPHKTMTTPLPDDRPVIGIAWRADTGTNSYQYHYRAIEAAGGRPVLLPEVKSAYLPYDGDTLAAACLDSLGILRPEYAEAVKRYGYRGSNAEAALRGIDAVVFTGGEDIVPTLFARPEPWHGIESERNFNATRDVADLLLMRYCLDHDIALLAICRGFQIMGVAEGCPLIQDIPAYYAAAGRDDRHVHRNPPVPEGHKRAYACHDVAVTDHASLLYRIMRADTLRRVPSWHHQGIASVEGSPLKATAVTTVDGITLIEAFERPDRRFALGLQFHPEVAVCKRLDREPAAERFASIDESIAYFSSLVDEARRRRAAHSTP